MRKKCTKIWSQYNRALINRGSLSLWISKDAQNQWLSRDKPRRRGRRKFYSDHLIHLSLCLKYAYKLSYRSLQGLMESICAMAQIDLPIPVYTQVCRRAMGISHPKLSKRRPIAIALDSTGLKVFGEGEWKVRKHGSSKRRQWIKIHLSMDPKSGEVIAVCTSESDAHDSRYLPGLLRPGVKEVLGDGAYDTEGCRSAIKGVGARAVIPPRRGSRVRDGTEEWRKERNQDVAEVIGLGNDSEALAIWKIAHGYHRRSLVETTMSRWKGLLGPELSSRERRRQDNEVQIKAWILNQYAKLGMRGNRVN